MIGGPEWATVESRFIDHLTRIGWKFVSGNLEDPSATGRASFRDVLIKKDLRKALKVINLREGQPWLDDDRVSQAVSELERIATPKLMEANQLATNLLLKGIDVEGLPDWEQGRARSVHFIDWEHPERNQYTVMNQFRVDCPGGQVTGFIVPDLVLFVNGIPVVVVECKSPGIQEPIAEAVDQLRRYSNARREAGDVNENEGSPRLFFTNQFLVATSFDQAAVGTIGGDAQHYMEWKDTAPLKAAAVAAELNLPPDAPLSSQQKLVAGMLRREHLLDIIKHFTLYQQVSGRTVKVVCRYQQFRAVQASVQRLLTGKTRLQDGEYDRRGGVVWHTQGSGKSLTMVFLMRKLRSLPKLRRFKVVIVTDRKDLQVQLSETAELTGETVTVAASIDAVKRLLSVSGPGIIFATIQKYAGRDEADPNGESPGDMGVLNEDESVLVMVDEAHRSHSSGLHGSLLKALPNAARIGFTGTPIIMGAKKKTAEIFGEPIDRYTIKESEADGSTVPILYEGRTAEGAVSDGRNLDQLFEDLFRDVSKDELEAIRKKYATAGTIFEAEKLIAAKARDMLHHYVETLLPNGLKAQVVAHSRLAAIRYVAAFLVARDELVAEAEALDEATRQQDDEALQSRPQKVRVAVRASRYLGLLRNLEFAAIISGSNNDDPAWSEWTDAAHIKTRIARYKKALIHKDPAKADPLAFIIVKSMLLTGFDAPVEGVMYLDRSVREAELLQAIARVNRTGHGKTAGLLVDYFGVARHLQEALAEYEKDDIRGALKSLTDELPTLRDRHQRLVDFFKEHKLPGFTAHEQAVVLLGDEKLRAGFTVMLRRFLEVLDLVLPRPEGLPYVKAAKDLSFIYARARNLYRVGMPPIGRSVGAKVRQLVDEHVISLGVDPKIPPISITDADFSRHVERQVSPRAKASEMEHAIRYHIRQHLDEDPVHFTALSERLEELLKKFGENWDQMAMELGQLVAEVEGGRQRDETGLDPQTQGPFFAVLLQEREKDGALTADAAKVLTEQTRALVEVIRSEVSVVGFWRATIAQQQLRGQVFAFLADNDVVVFERAGVVADRLMELAKANHERLVRA